jgi:hypothetical protein
MEPAVKTLSAEEAGYTLAMCIDRTFSVLVSVEKLEESGRVSRYNYNIRATYSFN